MSSTIITEIQTLPHRLESEWATENPVIAKNYGAYSTDTHLMRVGDGSKKWSELSAFSPTSYIGPHAHTHISGGSDPIDFSSLSSSVLESLHFNTNRATSTIWTGTPNLTEETIYTFPNNFFGSIVLKVTMIDETQSMDVTIYLDGIKAAEVHTLEDTTSSDSMDYIYVPKDTVVTIKANGEYNNDTTVSINGGWC